MEKIIAINISGTDKTYSGTEKKTLKVELGQCNRSRKGLDVSFQVQEEAQRSHQAVQKISKIINLYYTSIVISYCHIL